MRRRIILSSVMVPMILALLAAGSHWGGAAGAAPAPNEPFAAGAPNNALWREVAESSFPVQGTRLIVPAVYRTLALDEVALSSILAQAPLENTVALGAGTLLALPLPDGSLAHFHVVKSPIMAAALAAQFPQIQTYLGQGVDDPTATVRFDRTPSGFHALILGASGSIAIDPYSRNDTAHYISYFAKDEARPAAQGFNELGVVRSHPLSGNGARPAASGPTLRTYRLALAADGEYTQFFGGTVAGALAAMVTSVNRVNGVYERELAVRMVLIANETSIIYTNAATDPYTNDDGFAMLDENQSNLDTVIGNANYDFGHVFSTGGGGVAGLGVICSTGEKAQGVTGNTSPVGDNFDIDYVAHEMGHQFGADHSFNGTTSNCGGGNRNGPTAYEPGSGSTIMAYAGICGAEDLQPHSDPYFHTTSFDEIQAYIGSGTGASCAATSASGNHAPVPNAGASYTIPKQTAFRLTGSATDQDGDALTYDWEQFNIGAAAPPNTDNGNRPIFRSFNPTTDPSRVFPKLTDIISNTTTFGESLPTTTRTLTFRLTVRDNRLGGGGVDHASVNIPVSAAAGPFLVTAPNTAVTWPVGSNQTVTWDVANTTAAPVSCPTVNILLSTDGGYTFPTSLLAGTTNDGSEVVTVPNSLTTRARVQVACANNIFFDISNVDFTIGGAVTATATTAPATATATAAAATSTATATAAASTATATRTSAPSTATATRTVAATATPCTISFSDVQDTTTYYYQGVYYLACRGVISGYSDGTYKPFNNTTRAQMTKIVTLAFNLALVTPPATGTFADVDSSSVFYQLIETAVAHGIVSGYTCGGVNPQTGTAEPCTAGNRPYFRPSNFVSRGQLAKIVVIGAGWTLHTPPTPTFSDVAASNVFYPFIETAVCHGVISGYSNGTFQPNANAFRGQIAKIVYLAVTNPPETCAP